MSARQYTIRWVMRQERLGARSSRTATGMYYNGSERDGALVLCCREMMSRQVDVPPIPSARGRVRGGGK